MAASQNPFSLEIPVQVGNLNTVFFINENLYITSPETACIPHNHHDYELWYIAAGCCRQQIGDSLYQASSGELLLVHPLEYHYRMPEPLEPTTAQYNLRFTVEAPSRPATAAQKRAFNDMMQFLSETRLIQDSKRRLIPYFRRLSDEFRQKRPGFVGSIKALCGCLLTEFIRLSGKRAERILPGETLTYHGYSRSRIDEFFHYKYLTDVKIQQLAEDMKITPRQVNRVIHKMFGLSFTQKLTEMRLHWAVRQLTQTEKSVAQISRECGFNSYDYFFTCFRKQFQLSPGEYRLKHAKANETSECRDVSEKQSL